MGNRPGGRWGIVLAGDSLERIALGAILPVCLSHSGGIGEPFQLAGVTVRTLHHYDEIGLLRRSGRSEAGYRLYAYEDLARLQAILVWRQLGFPLSEIQPRLDDPEHDRLSALRTQRELVTLELGRLAATARALDAALAAHEQGIEMEVTSMFEDFDPSEYEDEARERWGQTEADQASARRAAGYGEREIADLRFAANYEKVATGLAMYGHDAVVANAGFASTSP